MSRRTVLAGIAAIFAAMLGRMGWVNWLGVLQGVAIADGVLLSIAVLAAVVLGPPVFVVWGIAKTASYLTAYLTAPSRPAAHLPPARPAGNGPR